MKNLADLLENIKIISIIGEINKPVNSIEFDSRKIKENDIFVAHKGVLFDGHVYINKAIEKKANTIICETIPDKIIPHITYIKVKNTKLTLGEVANNYFDKPSKKIKLIGVTGTNGKTTTTTLLYELFKKLGKKCALISTIKISINDLEIESKHTTPDAFTIHQTIQKAYLEGCEYVFMEVSSHGIDQERIAGLRFSIALFNNITHDHLDYHKTFENYLNTKKKFFDLLDDSAIAITNKDDKNGLYMLQNSKAKKKSYALKTIADYKGKIVKSSFIGMEININNTHSFWTSLVGEFNAYNILGVYSVAIELGFDSVEVLTKMSELKNVSGRFENFVSKTKVFCIIDYAHTPDALENVLKTIHKIKKNDQNLITVFGCGGNRDKEKRPLMGKIAAQFSNQIIITNDNPRDEEPEDIIKQIKKGISKKYERNLLTITDRKEAIKTAFKLCISNDIVLIAGKGHETYQEIKGKKINFDDLKIAKEIIKDLNL
ncbi:MAG: UDP-N-acetylmuramoyl-L-alanyl-D-glutamate--2,6-diaminopimelate ligase [Solirubrobacteraceae bacterium]